jgi:diphthine-ammonia ligase
MKLGVLFSGGKDSTYAVWLVKKQSHEIACLISIFSKNEDSYMFHTPAIGLTKKQAELMEIPLIIAETEGEKEEELRDLKEVIQEAIKRYSIEGIVTGALASVYQASRIQKICNELNIDCINPLWCMDQEVLLKQLIDDKFHIIVSAVAAHPLDQTWVGKKIDHSFLKDILRLKDKYRINIAGEGGEFESLVLDCPLFKKYLNVEIKEVLGNGNQWRALFI